MYVVCVCGGRVGCVACMYSIVWLRLWCLVYCGAVYMYEAVVSGVCTAYCGWIVCT